MATEVPQPADEEFESRLSWSPPVDDGDALPVRPATAPATRRRGRPAPERDHREGDATALTEIRELLLGLRADLAELRRLMERGDADEPGAAPRVLRRQLDAGFQRLSEQLQQHGGISAGGDGPTSEELDALRGEMAQLRRRIGLRAAGAAASLDDASVARIADAVVTRLSDPATSPLAGRRRR